jgi:hypothetical protein
MTDHGIQTNSAGWLFFVKASFACSLAAVAVGVYFLPVDAWVRGYVATAFLFAIGSAFTLAKTIRDEHEAQRLINRISEAKTERILKDHDPESAGVNHA